VNHLAHLALAARARGVGHAREADEALLVGGFLGDFVKGPMRGERPARIELGIRLHRAIDAQTARDPDILRSVERFGPALRRLAPIFVDILGDHLLARRFEQHHGQPLDDFSATAFASLRRHRAWLPDDARLLGDRLEAWDGLVAYRDTDVVERGFVRITKRLRHAGMAREAIACLHAQLPALDDDFTRYYPRLVEFASTWLERESSSGPPANPA
jgi:acyl carrier protein phosphodiesterase